MVVDEGWTVGNFRRRLQNELYELADLVEKIVGKDPAVIRQWVNTAIEGLGKPAKYIRSGNVTQLINHLKTILHTREQHEDETCNTREENANVSPEEKGPTSE